MKWFAAIVAVVVAWICFEYVKTEVLQGAAQVSTTTDGSRPGRTTPTCAYRPDVGRRMPVSRLLFESDVKGKTPAEVCERYGAPDSTGTSGGTDYWYYRGYTRDETSGRIDGSVQVVFERGAVRSINF